MAIPSLGSQGNSTRFNVLPMSTIRTEQEYENALNRLDALWDKVDGLGMTEEESDEFNELQTAVEEYEGVESEE